LEQRLEANLHQELAELDAGLRFKVEALKLHLRRLEAIQHLQKEGRVDPRIESLIQETISSILESMSGQRLGTSKL